MARSKVFLEKVYERKHKNMIIEVGECHYLCASCATTQWQMTKEDWEILDGYEWVEFSEPNLGSVEYTYTHEEDAGGEIEEVVCFYCDKRIHKGTKLHTFDDDSTLEIQHERKVHHENKCN